MEHILEINKNISSKRERKGIKPETSTAYKISECLKASICRINSDRPTRIYKTMVSSLTLEPDLIRK